MPFNKAFRARSNSLTSTRPIEPLHFTRDSSTTGRLTSKVCIFPSQSSLEVVLLDFELEAETAVCVDKSIFGEVSDCVELWFNIANQIQSKFKGLIEKEIQPHFQIVKKC